MSEEHGYFEMDAISAHLDHGWDMLRCGDLASARISANHVLKLNNESPEGYTLLGAVAAAEGESEEAIELLQQAIDLDPTYLDALLYAAEIAIHHLQDIEYALKLCSDAEPLAIDAEEKLDLSLLKAEAYLANDNLEKTKTAAQNIPSPPYPAPVYGLRAGRIFLELGQTQQAISLLRTALESSETVLDASYLLGIALELEEKPAEALEYFFQVHEMEQRLPAPPWSSALVTFEKWVYQAMQKVSEPVRELIQKTPIKILEYPSPELIAEGFDPRGMVFFSGLPVHGASPKNSRERSSRSTSNDGAERSQLIYIFIYKRNVERSANSESKVIAELSTALEGEAALFFSLKDDSISSPDIGGSPRCPA